MKKIFNDDNHINLLEAMKIFLRQKGCAPAVIDGRGMFKEIKAQVEMIDTNHHYLSSA